MITFGDLSVFIRTESSLVTDRIRSGNIIGFNLETGFDLSSSDKITLSYEVKYLSANGSESLVNRASAKAENAPEVTDEHEVWPSDADQSDLKISKGSSEQSYAAGEYATYNLRVTNGNSREAALNVKIHDELDPATVGIASIVKGSVKVYDERGNALAASVTYSQADSGQITSFDIEVPGELTTNEAIEAVYQVKISQDVEQGTQIENTCWAAADNTGKATDSHDVLVDGSEKPDPRPEDDKPQASEPHNPGPGTVHVNKNENNNVNENSNVNENNIVIDILAELRPDSASPEDPADTEQPSQKIPEKGNSLKGLDKTGDQLAAWLASSGQWLLLALGACIAACWFVPKLAVSENE